jgi:hypothetical protein
MKIRPMVAGTRTITAPAAKLNKKFDKEGVIDLNVLYYNKQVIIILMVCHTVA